MPDEYVTLEVHREFEKRMESEHDRQNHRITELEADVKDNRKLTSSVEILARSVERIAMEQEKMSARLTAIEQEPAENWRKLLWIIASAIVGAAVGYFLR